MHWWAVWLAVPIQVSAACNPRERVTSVDGFKGVHRLDLRDGCNQSRTRPCPRRRYRDPTTPPRTNGNIGEEWLRVVGADEGARHDVEAPRHRRWSRRPCSFRSQRPSARLLGPASSRHARDPHRSAQPGVPERHLEPRCQRGVDCLVSRPALSGATTPRGRDELIGAVAHRTRPAVECSTGIASSSSWSSARPCTTL